MRFHVVVIIILAVAKIQFDNNLDLVRFRMFDIQIQYPANIDIRPFLQYGVTCTRKQTA